MNAAAKLVLRLAKAVRLLNIKLVKLVANINAQKQPALKTCCEYKCSETTCPDGYICEKETCSNKYCIIGCKSGYGDLNTYWSDGLLGCWLSGNIINGYGCVKIPDCSSLGFSQTVSDCSGKKYLVCPFNCNQVFCLSD